MITTNACVTHNAMLELHKFTYNNLNILTQFFTYNPFHNVAGMIVKQSLHKKSWVICKF